MPQAETLRVVGYRDVMRAFARADKETKREVRKTFRKVGEAVRLDAAARLAPVSARSAAGYRTSVRQKGVAVQQRLRKTTRKHPEWGSYQMRHALLPAMRGNQARTEKAFEDALDQVCDHFNRGSAV